MKKIMKSLYQSVKPKWPKPKHDDSDQPYFLFLLTPPNSGSTAIAKVLDSSHRTMTLTPNGEGQWLVPGLCSEDRWDPDKEVDYSSVKAVWLNRYQRVKSKHPDVDVVIEKSPPNMMRIADISRQFDRVSFLANNRDPYANCSSRLFRYHDVDKITSLSRQEILRELARDWMARSRRIREFVEDEGIPVLTYERFCESPSLLLDMLSLPEGVAETISLNANVKVKDYELQPIINQNQRQISNLTAADIDCLSSVLNADRDLLGYFDYALL